MKRFYVVNNRDAALSYVSALKLAGYEETTLQKADFIFTDFERPIIKQGTADRPLFVYPHTPYAYWLWDKWLAPMPVACNFVVGEGAVMGMRAYGYPYRVEACGFPRCEVLPFTPTHGRNLLYASAHLLGSKKIFPHEGDAIMHDRTMAWIAKNRNHFDKVTINYSVSLEANRLEKYRDYGIFGINFVELGEHSKLSADMANNQFKGVDLVISCNTFGYLALAKGIPTILFGFEKDAPDRSSTGFGNHYNLYKSHYEFPLALEEMTADTVLDLRHHEPESVTEWKRVNIGNSFDAEKFIAIVREYV